ncbi:hypothetical protein [Alkalicoccus luteus]|uniref:Uncharacterized protein n=1 Tax=Alkalicoccus luteus TaxID=1237094 RepID=A0A969TSR8_9BACI|nr:hypothetical protein [Alkalicoccus luteus]NJP36863.1 hypothetical protein [Alkalicoccus luteus]
MIRYAAALSSACWLFQEKLEQQIKDAALAPQHRIYIDTGTDEHVGSVGPKAYMESVFTTAKVLQQTKADTRFHVQENGMHEEASWGERFSEAVMYLFEGGSR